MGYADGTFRPDQYITRAEAMTLINRVLGRDNIAQLHADMKLWSDNPSSAWYYEAVQEATNSHEYTRDTATDAEIWTKVLDALDWTALETAWSTAGGM